MNPEPSCVVRLQAQPLDIAMHEGAEPLLAVGLVDGHAQLFRYRAREEGESSTSNSSDDDEDDDGSDDDDGDEAKRRRAREKRRDKRLAAAAKSDQPPVRRYASALAWSRPPPSSSSGQEPPSCRAVRFMGGGGGENAAPSLLLACGFGDGSLAALDASAGGKEVWRTGPKAHGAAVSRVLPAPGLGGSGSDRLLVAGDEDGVLCVWDLRSKGGGGGGGGGKGGRGKSGAATAAPAATPALRCAEHTDFISDLCAGGPRRPHMLLATSGDGTLSVHDTRAASSASSSSSAAAAAATNAKKTGASARRRADGLVARSEPGGADDELLSVCVARGGSKVVAGGQSGVLSIFSWGEWEDPSDRFPGHPESVDALCAVDGDTLLTGSSDGLIRVIGLLPNRLLGVLGVHGDDGSPVERLAVGGGEGSALRALASSGHGECVRLWDLGCFFEEDEDESEEEEVKEEAGAAAEGKDDKEKQQDPGAAVLAAAARAAAKKKEGSPSSSSDSDSDSESDSDSDDDDERAGKRRKRERTRMTKQTRDGGLAAKQKANFFSGLLDE